MNCSNCTDDFITPIVKVVDYCNFTCSFCRYHLNEIKNTMEFSTYCSIVEKACEYNIAHNCNHVTIIYHGGEPLLWGYNNFENAIAFQSELKMRYPKLKFRNSIQTNGFLLDNKWIDFFVRNDFNIGVSIDGPKEFNFHKNDKESLSVLDNIGILSKLNCKFGILTVVTDNHAGRADEYYDFLVTNNIHSVGLCFCIYDEERKFTVDNNILTGFLTRLFDRYYWGDYRLNIREFDNVIKLILGVKTNACAYSYRQRCGNYFSICTNGDVLFCDPFSLNVKPIDNILKVNFFDIKHSLMLENIVDCAKESIYKECSNCSIYDICGAGCFRHTFGGGKNAFCDTYKILYPHILKTVNANRKNNDNNTK